MQLRTMRCQCAGGLQLMEDQAAHQCFAGKLARGTGPRSVAFANRFELLRWDHLLQYAQELRILHRRPSPSQEKPRILPWAFQKAIFALQALGLAGKASRDTWWTIAM